MGMPTELTSTEGMMIDRTPEIATLLRQKPVAEGRIQGIGRHNATKAALDVLRDRMEALRRDQNALRERMAALLPDLPKTGSASWPPVMRRSGGDQNLTIVRPVLQRIVNLLCVPHIITSQTKKCLTTCMRSYGKIVNILPGLKAKVIP
jgi:hypothetical protein